MDAKILSKILSNVSVVDVPRLMRSALYTPAMDMGTPIGDKTAFSTAYGANKMGEDLCTIHINFDYSQNTDFVLPDWPYFPKGARPYDASNISFDDMREGFNKMIGSHWGRVVEGLDMTQQGAMQIQGDPLWGKVMPEVYSEMFPSPKVADGQARFWRVRTLEVRYFDNARTEFRNAPILIGGNIGSFRFGVLLVPMHQIRAMPVEKYHAAFGDYVTHQFNVPVKRIKIPFPFYTRGVKYEDYQCFDKVDFAIHFEISAEYAVTYMVFNRERNAESILQVSNLAHTALTLTGYGKVVSSSGSLYSLLAKHMEHAAKNGLLSFGSLVTGEGEEYSVHTARNRELLVATFEGAKTTLAGQERFDEVDTQVMPVPAGLEELPVLERGYFYIGDLQGVLYVTDKNRQRVLMPYQLFDLVKLRGNLAIAKESKNSSNADLVAALERNIQLIEALFQHQAAILHGTAMAYEAMNYQTQGGFE
jgi:hypothetical protein